MPLTKKETLLLQDLKAEEQLCIEKYGRYAEQASDETLKCLLQKIGTAEENHLKTIDNMLQGEVPQPAPAKKGPKQQKQNMKSKAGKAGKQSDAYLCSDLLATEKHASSMYNTSVFEFANPQLRTVLNQIQTQEQNHGEQIYEYMAQNKMYN